MHTQDDCNVKCVVRVKGHQVRWTGALMNCFVSERSCTIQGVGCVNSVCGAHVLCSDAAWRLSVYVFDMGLPQALGPCDIRVKGGRGILAIGRHPHD